jgi:tape measure domain-containing protein
MAVSNVELRVDARNAITALQKVNRASGQADTATQQLTRSVARSGGAMDGMSRQARNASKSVATLGNALRNLAVAAGAVQAARFVFAKTAELETQTRSIQTLTGSVQQAKQIIQELQAIGAVTPFTSSELIETAKRLSAFGVTANEVVDITRRLGDVAGATGANLGELALAYGQVQAKSRLQGEELLQFQERGIALQAELRKMYGLTGEEFSKALSKGQISAEAVEVAIKRLTDAGGKYANGAIAQSTTLAGKFSTLQDGIEGIARSIGTALSPAIKAVLNEAIFAVNSINQLISTGARARGFGLSQSQRKDILSQAQSEAEQIVNLRRIANPFERNKQFQEVARQRERDLIEAYGIRTGQVKAPAAAPSAPSSVPQLLGGSRMAGGGGGRAGGRARARDAERAAKAAADELARVNAIVRERKAETEIMMLREGMADRISEAEVAGDRALQIRLQGEQRALDIQYKYAQELAKENAPRAQRAIIEQGLSELYINQNQTQRELAEFQRQADQERLVALQKAIELQYEQNTAIQQQKQLADGVANTIGQGMTSAFDALISGAQSWEKSLAQIASGVLVDIANQLIRIFIIEQAINAIRSFLSPGGAPTTGPSAPPPPAAPPPPPPPAAPPPPPPPPPQRAGGGSVRSGQPYLVGERGPELFMPGRSGAIAPSGSFGGGVNVIVNVDASGTNVQGNEPDANQLGRVISTAVQSEIIKQQRPGGLLSSTRR